MTTELSPLDQILPRVHTPTILTFPVSQEQIDPASHHLRQGLKQVTAEIPFLAYDVAKSAEQPGAVELQQGMASQEVLFKVKDLTNAESLWKKSYRSLYDSYMPMSELDGKILAPSGVMTHEKAVPVMAVQMNIIEGGCLLFIYFHHSVMDGLGFATVLRRWAYHCRKSQRLHETHAERSIWSNKSLDRSPLINGGQETKVQNHPGYRVTQASLQNKVSNRTALSRTLPTMPAMTAAIFEFDVNTIGSLKQEAVKHLFELGQRGTSLSTNDVLCAVLWRAITAARTASRSTQSEEDSAAEQVGLGMAVNCRERLKPPLLSTYVGNGILYSLAKSDLSVLKASSLQSLTETALAIRKSIALIDDAYIRSLIHLVNCLPDVSAIKPALDHFLGKDLVITSWLELGLYDLDWGHAIGGVKADFVRLPKLEHDGVCIILPRTQAGTVEVIVTLKTEHMDQLKQDQAFQRLTHLKCQ